MDDILDFLNQAFMVMPDQTFACSLRAFLSRGISTYPFPRADRSEAQSVGRVVANSMSTSRHDSGQALLPVHRRQHPCKIIIRNASSSKPSASSAARRAFSSKVSPPRDEAMVSSLKILRRHRLKRQPARRPATVAHRIQDKRSSSRQHIESHDVSNAGRTFGKYGFLRTLYPTGESSDDLHEAHQSSATS
jgi:hypothetical protein